MKGNEMGKMTGGKMPDDKYLPLAGEIVRPFALRVDVNLSGKC